MRQALSWDISKFWGIVFFSTALFDQPQFYLQVSPIYMKPDHMNIYVCWESKKKINEKL